MNEPQPRDAFGEERFNQIIAEFLEAQQSGNEPKRETLLEQHPDLAEELKAFFADHDKMGALAQPLRPTEIIGARKNRSDGAAPPPGTMLRYFGDYELVEEIARGGMGVVYKARQMSLDRTVAVKMILAGQLASEEDVQRFHSEAEAAAKLDHPGIVPIFEVGQHEGQHFFSMGFVDGESLATKVADGPLPPREAAQLTKMIAEAVTYAHGQGVIHRDLKPANVVLDSKGRPRVTDFGLAKRIAADSSLTATGQVIGTPSYMSPEQAAGKTDQIGKHSDVYSLGALLYCLLTGRPPFHAASVMETLNQVLEEEPVSPRQLNPAVNRDLDTICLKCLEKGPRARYNSAQELADELQRFLEGKPIVARPVGWAERAHRWCRRNPVVAGLSATVVLALLAGIVVSTYFAVQSDRNATRMAREYQRAEDLLEQKTALAGGLAVALKGQTAATERAERQQLRAEQMLYVNQIARARSEWESGNVAAAWESLDACRWDLRGWEHDYLYTLFNQNQQAFLGHTGPVYSVAFSPDGRRIVSGSLDNTLKLWNWSKHRNRSRVGH